MKKFEINVTDEMYWNDTVEFDGTVEELKAAIMEGSVDYTKNDGHGGIAKIDIKEV